MANLKIPRKPRLGRPPSTEAAGHNLEAPEVAPQDLAAFANIDGRSLRATGRTHQLATRVKPETLSRIKYLAARDRITMAELIERAVEAYEQAR